MNTNYRHSYRKRRKKSKVPEIIALVLAIVTVCCAYAGVIDPRHFFPAPFLTLSFIPLLALLVLALIVAMLLRRWKAALPLAVALLLSIPIIRLYIPYNSTELAPPEPADPTLSLKVMTYNVLSYNYNEKGLADKPSATMRLILDSNPDVVLIQEGAVGGSNWCDIPSLAPLKYEIQSRYPYSLSGDDGLNIISKYPFTTEPLGETKYKRSPLGYNRNTVAHVARAYDLQLPSGKQLRLVDFRLQSYHLSFGKNPNVRVSPEVKPAPLERMRRSFALRGDDAQALRTAIDSSPGNVIVCGDLNDVPSSYVYRVIRGKDLRDAWVDAGNGYAYTYNSHNLLYRIDHVFYRGGLLPVKAQRIEGGTSDHYPLMITFDIDVSQAEAKETLTELDE